ncbi:glycosyltransferase [Mastigocoleus testarum]|uniref:Dolichol-phosphate mannosyltransferase n=1 Tax=Mastigocoleus testarum BC008 TaxID=371196 RepID=A0A0V7ZFD4_9CYAN|nr:glycosyltransferase [Mastigocoleus testarum]KST63285.1 sulfonate ABC transporter permease [Mastigocoleus testarum BC008]
MNFISSESVSPVFEKSLRIPKSPPALMNAANSNIYFSLVIPTYQERENIALAIEMLSSLLDECLAGNYEIIVVDDDSPDRTWKVAENLTKRYPQLRVMRREKERGLSSAVIRGWQIARGRILGVIDGDLQHPPEVLIELLGLIKQGADLAVASRHVEGGGVSSWSFIRRFLSRGAQVIGLILLPHVLGRVSDPMSGYFLVKRSSIAEQNLNPVGYKILLEVLARGNIDCIAEAGYVFCEREQGESKVTWKQYVEYIHHLVRLRLSTKQMKIFHQRIDFPFNRFIRFGLVGLSGVFVDMVLLYLLSDPSTLGLPVTSSKIFAAEIAIINNFLWNDAWTFADVTYKQQEWRQRLKRFLKFNTICLAGLVLNVLILSLLLNFVIPYQYRNHVWLLKIFLPVNFVKSVFEFQHIFTIQIRVLYIANFIAIAVTTIWNFWVNLKLSWRVTDVK